MTNKWKRRIILLGLGIALLLLGVHVAFQIISRADWVHRLMTQKFESATGREVRWDRLDLSWRGLRLSQFALANEGGFEHGKALHLKEIRIKISLLHLLYGHLKIKAVAVEGLHIAAVRDEQGKLNLDLGTAADEEEEPSSASSLPFNFSVDELHIRQAQLSYTDKKDPWSITLDHTDLVVSGFKWDKDFKVRFNTTAHLEKEAHHPAVTLELTGTVNLADGDFTQARVNEMLGDLRAEQARLQWRGSVNNWIHPSFLLQIKGTNLSSKILEGLVQTYPELEIENLAIGLQGAVDTEKQKLTLQKGEIALPGLQMKASGNAQLDFSRYGLKSQIEADLSQWSDWSVALKPYQLGGLLTWDVDASHEKITTHAVLKDGAGKFIQTGELSRVELTLDGQEQMDFQHGNAQASLTGDLNAEPFEINVSLEQTPQKIMATLKAAADKVLLPPATTAAPAEPAPAEPAPAAPANKPTTRSWALAPIELKADVSTGVLDAPYLNGKDLSFQADLLNVTPDLKQTHGNLSLSLQEGSITDLYRLSDANVLVKVLFFSLNTVGKVFNSLDVLSVLGGLAGLNKDKKSGDESDEIIQMIPGEDGELIPVRVPASKRKVEGKMAYHKFLTNLDFNQGFATIQKGIFVSDTMSFAVTGNADFNSEKLDMTVRAAPGRHEPDGIMPLTLHIGGTLSEPQGNMRLMHSVSALVQQGVTNNFASRAVKKGVSGVWGLFKKDSTPGEENSPADTEENLSPAQELPADTADSATASDENEKSAIIPE